MQFFWRKKRSLRQLSLERPKAARPRAVEELPAEKWIPTVLLGTLTTLVVAWLLVQGMPYSVAIAARVGIVLLAALITALLFRYFHPEIFGHSGKMCFFGACVVLVLACGKLFVAWADLRPQAAPTGTELHSVEPGAGGTEDAPGAGGPGEPAVWGLRWILYATPLTLGTMLLAISLSRGLAVVTVFLLALLLGCESPEAFPDMAAQIPGCVVVALGVGNLRFRSKLIELGALAGLVHFASIWAVEAHGGANPFYAVELRHLLRDGGVGFANALAAGFLLTGGLPYLERILGITSDLTLLELSDLNQPVLKKLATEAPGTYHHSIIMAQLAEAAAEALGANSLLARVGAYYHDIGKTAKPEYFTENESERGSKHKKLSPNMSTLIIIAHVKDGVELGELYGLPQPILDFIPQHHGTSCVEYFYMQALSESEENGEDTPELDKDSFRYPGPRPRSKETAIVMLADSVEATSRSLSEFTPSKLEGMVRETIQRKMADGQLNESPITLGDLKVIEESFVRTLAGVFHHRVKYPEAEEKGERPERGEKPERAGERAERGAEAEAGERPDRGNGGGSSGNGGGGAGGGGSGAGGGSGGERPEGAERAERAGR
ncbi:MAG: HDIG domain-containing protein [Planctomycetes bacterium]|nr:HDIG domain-containing protein [Planctomycetota bacterium]